MLATGSDGGLDRVLQDGFAVRCHHQCQDSAEGDRAAPSRSVVMRLLMSLVVVLGRSTITSRVSALRWRSSWVRVRALRWRSSRAPPFVTGPLEHLNAESGPHEPDS